MANPNEFQNFHIGVKGILVYENKALIVKANDDGFWEIPGGRIDKNEWYEDTLKREMREELGVEFAEDAEVKLIGVNQAEKYKLRHDGTDLILIIFRIKLKSQPEIILSEEHSEYKWVEMDELDGIEFRTSNNIGIYTDALNA